MYKICPQKGGVARPPRPPPPLSYAPGHYMYITLANVAVDKGHGALSNFKNGHVALSILEFQGHYMGAEVLIGDIRWVSFVAKTSPGGRGMETQV